MLAVGSGFSDVLEDAERWEPAGSHPLDGIGDVSIEPGETLR
jgi:hypothetical protein